MRLKSIQLTGNRLDLEMPGPIRRRGQHLINAYKEGLLDLSYIDVSAIRVLELLYKSGKADNPDWQEGKEKADNLPEHREILRRAGGDGIYNISIKYYSFILI